jgi:hemolysin activation/secretion protein
MPVVTTIGKEYDRDGIGGYRTVRGLLRDRVQALDEAYYNIEFRWKFVKFKIKKQNIYLGLNAFFDGVITTRYYDLSYKGINDPSIRSEYDKYINTTRKDGLHMAAGGGLRIAINQNFIIAVDYAVPFKKQDGKGSLYVNTGFLF